MNLSKISILVILLFANSLVAEGLKEYYIYCDKSELDNIYENAQEDIYIDISIKYSGIEWSDTRMRIRGDGSREYPKKSLKIKFDKDIFENGNDVLNLNSEWTDPTYVRQFLATKLFRESGHICFKSELVAVYVNDEFFGIYLAVENMDSKMMEDNGLDSKANMYKATIDGASLSINDEIYKRWEKKSNESADWLDLEELIDSLYYVPNERYYQYLQDNFEYESLVNFLAMTIMITNKSTYTHNYYMYHDINGNGKWNILPWDMDKTFKYAGWWYRIDFSSSDWFNDNPLIERGMINEQVRADIFKRCGEINEMFFVDNKMGVMYDSLKALLSPYIELDNNDDIESSEEWEQSLSDEMEYFEKRYDEVAKQFNESPKNFRVEKIFEPVFSDEVTISWTPSKSMVEDEELEYIFSYGPKPHYDVDAAVVTEGIVDTFFTIKNLEPNQKYYYMVVAKAKSYTVAWDSFNYFWTKEKNKLPCEITNEITLNKNGSPYVISCDVVIEKSAKLIMEEGVVVYFEGEHTLTVLGDLEINGSVEEPVKFKPIIDDGKLLEIVFDKAEGRQNINNCELNEVVIWAGNSDMKIDNMTLKIEKFDLSVLEAKNKNRVFNFHTANLDIRNSKFICNYSGEGLLISDATADIDNCLFTTFTDPLEFINMPGGGSIINSRFIDVRDDAIDLNQASNVLIENNFIYKCIDKGISVGQAYEDVSDNVVIKNNVIIDTKIGIGVKGNITATIQNNNIIDSDYGVFSYKKEEENSGGGTAYVKNCIFYDNKNDVFKDDSSILEVSYSLSNSKELVGEHNIFADPMFVDYDNNNFSLMTSSPCIDSGSPDIKDPDGTISDIGAYYYNQGAYNIVINEFNYNSAPDFPVEDWVEFYNTEDSDIDLSNWTLKDEKEDNIFVFPVGTKIEAKGYLVLVRNEVAFKTYFPKVNNIISAFDFGLGNNGDQLRLFNNLGVLIDSLEYDDKSPWEEMPDGNGPSLELINPYRDNTLAENWSFSDEYGSPGKKNHSYKGVKEVSIRDYIEVYPNPSSEYFSLRLEIKDSNEYRVSIYDFSGFEVLSLGELKYGINKLYISSIDKPGLYFVNLYKSNELLESKKIVILK